MRTDRGWRRFYATGWLVSAVAAGLAFRQWQVHVAEVEARAEEAERTKDEAARRQAIEERLRIARDLHDSLTHLISVITLQAGVAAHLAQKRGEPVPVALEAIREASAEATRELRTTLDVLRGAGDADANGFDRVPALVDRARVAGLPVTLEVVGEGRRTAPPIADAAYRLIQEGLTNVQRHAGPVATCVRIAFEPGAVVIAVENQGPPGAAECREGHGLTGMRERVDALAGELRVGPRAEGGFQVLATIPVPTT